MPSWKRKGGTTTKIVYHRWKIFAVTGIIAPDVMPSAPAHARRARGIFHEGLLCATEHTTSPNTLFSSLLACSQSQH